MKSFLRLQAASIGFDPTRVLTMSISLPEAKYPQPQQRGTFFQKVLERVAGLHGVRTAAAVGSLPFLESTSYSVFLEGRIIPGQGFGFRYYNISPGYFKAMGIRLLRGRWFTERDDQHAPPVAIISETAARRVFPNEDPLGKRFEITNERPILREIVGVVGDTKQFGRDDDAMKQVYEPYLQNPWSAMTLTIRTSDDPLSLANAVRGQVLAIDKDQPIANVQSMEGIVSRSVGDRRFSLLLFGIFAGIALLLAGIGTYGVVAYSVVQRRHEIGIRVALGAQRTDVLTLVLRQVGALAGIGIALGLAGSLALMRALNSQLYKVSSTDLTTFASVTILMITLAALASIFPAYHASRVDPMVAMRYE